MRLRGVDPSIYLKAIPLLLRNPSIAVAPLVVSLLQSILSLMIPSMAAGGGAIGSLNAGLTQLIVQLLNSVGLAVALIGADLAWRRGRASFDDAWEAARRKFGEILMAALGFNFVLWVALTIGAFVLGGLGGLGALSGLALAAIALFFFIYTMPAASIGGIPGGASLQISLERARANPLPTLGVFIVYVATFFILTGYATAALLGVLANAGVPSSTIVSVLVIAVVQAIAAAYVALVLSKTYSDISFGRVWY